MYVNNAFGLSHIKPNIGCDSFLRVVIRTSAEWEVSGKHILMHLA